MGAIKYTRSKTDKITTKSISLCNILFLSRGYLIRSALTVYTVLLDVQGFAVSQYRDASSTMLELSFGFETFHGYMGSQAGRLIFQQRLVAQFQVLLTKPP